MNLFQMECFLALSQSLNFTQTAEELFITQPTLSRSIAAMEQELGMQLLRRSTKAVELTAAGERFAVSCAGLLEQYHRGIEEAKLARDGSRGSLKLGIQQDAFEPFIVDLVRRFEAEHPEIALQLRFSALQKLQKGLHSGDLDLMIGAESCNLPNPGTLLLSERAECAVLPPEHPLAGRASLRMEELRQERFVAMSPTVSASGYALLLKYASDAGFTPDIVATAQEVPSLMMLAACGVGITVLYRDLEQSAQGRLRFVPLEGVAPFRRWLLWNRDSQNPALAAFLRSAQGI